MCESGDHHGGGDKSAGDKNTGQLGVFFSELFDHDFGIAQKGFLGDNTAKNSLPTADIGKDGSITFGPSSNESKMAFVLNDLRNSKSDTAKQAADGIFKNV